MFLVYFAFHTDLSIQNFSPVLNKVLKSIINYTIAFKFIVKSACHFKKFCKDNIEQIKTPLFIIEMSWQTASMCKREYIWLHCIYRIILKYLWQTITCFVSYKLVKWLVIVNSLSPCESKLFKTKMGMRGGGITNSKDV